MTINEAINRSVIFLDNVSQKLYQNRIVKTYGVGTGRVVKGKTDLPILYKEDNWLLFVYHPYSIPHSLWRSQEYSLFLRNKNRFIPPLLDLGCGDGSFSSVLFDNIEFGIDLDTEALQIAKRYNIYNHLIECSAAAIPIDDGAVQTVFSNSVLEHTEHIDSIVGEIARILKRGGLFIFTVPNNNFTRQISKLFGENEARRLNSDDCFSHKNLFSNEEWVSLLEKYSFKILTLHNYQTDELIQSYRRYSLMLLHFVEKKLKYLPRLNASSAIIKQLRKSIDLHDTRNSGTFIIAEKC